MIWFLLISLVALLALAGLFQFLERQRDKRRYPPPGRMVDIGGRRLHANIQGSGEPVVVFEAGLSASSVNWVGVHGQVAQFATACAYDRAGLAWSDPPRGEFNASKIVDDLKRLLDALGYIKPVVLVGHSFGGLLVRIFAERYPDRVASLVLVDPVLQCQWEHPDAEGLRVLQSGKRMTFIGWTLGGLGIVRALTTPALIRSAGYLQFLRTSRHTGGIVERLMTELQKLPRETMPLIRSHWCRPSNFRAMYRHIDMLPGSFAYLRGERLGIPVTVISAATTPPAGVGEHAGIARESAGGERIDAPLSGHWVQFDQPELVVAAVRKAVLRSGQGQPEVPATNRPVG